MDIYTIQACFPIIRYLKFMHKTLFSSIMEKNVKNDSRDPSILHTSKGLSIGVYSPKYLRKA